jgi:TPR repeat protein
VFRNSSDVFLDKQDASISSIVKQALDEIDINNCDKAFELLKPLIDKKDAVALFYASGFGVPGESLEEFESRGIKQLQKSAEYGYAPAIHELAVHYDAGEPVERDVEKAAQLFKKAAEKDHPHSQWIHGLDLLYGRNGIAKDEKLGVDYINKSALAKFEGALESMFEFYEAGKYGFPVDLDKAQHFKNQINDKDVLGY